MALPTALSKVTSTLRSLRDPAIARAINEAGRAINAIEANIGLAAQGAAASIAARILATEAAATAHAAAKTGTHGIPAMSSGQGLVWNGTDWIATDIATQAELNAVAAQAAGGVLAGTYPNPSFAADMATQAELDAATAAATTGALGRVKMVGTIADAANPKARSADDFQSTALTADVGPITAQTTLQNITGLGLTVGASATEMWLVKWWLLIAATDVTEDLKIGFTVPASCTMKGGALVGGTATATFGWNTVQNAASGIALATQATVHALGTINGEIGIPLVYVVFGGGTGGTVQPQYAQNLSGAGTLKVLKGSAMEATRIAT